MSNIKEYLTNYWPLVEKYYHIGFNYVYNLDYKHTLILIIIAAILIIIIAYRLFGLGAVIGLLLLYGLIYIVFINNIFGFYQKHTSEENQHMKAIEQEEQVK